MKHRILFIDDESSILTSLRRQLRDLPYEMSFALNGNAGLEEVVNNRFSLIIADMRMSEMTGVELLKKAYEVQPDAVRVILTGYSDLEAAVSAINEAKIDGYITKPWRELELKSDIRKWLEVYEQRVSNASELDDLRSNKEKCEKSIEELLELAMIDPLTGLANRRHFDEHMEQEWSRAQRNHTSFSFLIMDIDHFKRVNDTLGHAEGDRVLKDIAEVLVQSIQRTSDFIARFGGEEFVAILPEIDSLEHVAELVRISVQSVKVRNVDEMRPVTISIGGCICRKVQETGFDVESIIKTADDALYEAKNTGRDRVVIREIL